MPERAMTPLIVIVLLLGILFALRSINSSSVPPTPAPVSSATVLAPDMVPLVTGDEPIARDLYEGRLLGVPHRSGHCLEPMGA